MLLRLFLLRQNSSLLNDDTKSKIFPSSTLFTFIFMCLSIILFTTLSNLRFNFALMCSFGWYNYLFLSAPLVTTAGASTIYENRARFFSFCMSTIFLFGRFPNTIYLFNFSSLCLIQLYHWVSLLLLEWEYSIITMMVVLSFFYWFY